VKIQVRKLGTTNSVIIDYNFRDPVERNKLYKSVIDSGAPETILPYNVRFILGNNPHRFHATGYGSPSLVFVATTIFEVAIGDNDTWSKW
ncbi:13262_t:CDS:1, partial [Dentiscutata heterogama]